MSNQSNLGLYNSGTYLPFVCVITGVSNGQTTTVTTAINHAFVVGNEVLFFIPQQWGIRQLNNLTGIVLSTTSDTITVNIDSSQFDSFVTPSVSLPTVIDLPQLIPVGDQNTGTSTSNPEEPNLFIPGTYYNTFP